PHPSEAEVLTPPYNDLATAEALIAAHHGELAAVLIEPYQRTIVPAPGFLAGLRAATKRYGVPLIFDEIVTGFRFAYGGAQEYYGVVPDLAAYGKVVAGGFPLACIAGPKEIMRHFDAALEGTPDYVWQAGTFRQRHRVPARPGDTRRAPEARHVSAALQDRRAASGGARRRRTQARPGRAGQRRAAGV